MPSSQEKVVERWWEELWNGKHREVIDEIISPDFTDHDPSSPWVGPGTDGARALFDAYYAVFPDMHFDIQRQVTCDDTVVSHWRFRGTQKAELMGLAATGKMVEFDGISILQVTNGKISHQTIVWDTLGMLQRLGAEKIPPLPA